MEQETCALEDDAEYLLQDYEAALNELQLTSRRRIIGDGGDAPVNLEPNVLALEMFEFGSSNVAYVEQTKRMNHLRVVWCLLVRGMPM